MTRIALLLLLLICCEAFADINSGVAAYRRGDYATAIAEFEIAGGRDDPVAQNILGTMYAQGIGTARSYKLAMDWFFKAQALGFPEASANLAHMFAQGLGVPKNNAAALQYYREAALAGFPPAMQSMAEIYERGSLGVAPDAGMATEWRDRLRRAKAGVSKEERVTPTKAVTTAAPSGVNRATNANLPKPSSRNQAAVPRSDKNAQFERQVAQWLENVRQRERKLFVASTDNTPSLAAYLKELRTQLKSLLVTPFSASNPEERMIVTLTILRDGTIKDIESNLGSGNPNTDRKVLSSLKNLARLKPLPAETEGEADVLVVSVRLPIE